MHLGFAAILNLLIIFKNSGTRNMALGKKSRFCDMRDLSDKLTDGNINSTEEITIKCDRNAFRVIDFGSNYYILHVLIYDGSGSKGQLDYFVVRLFVPGAVVLCSQYPDPNPEPGTAMRVNCEHQAPTSKVRNKSHKDESFIISKVEIYILAIHILTTTKMPNAKSKKIKRKVRNIIISTEPFKNITQIFEPATLSTELVFRDRIEYITASTTPTSAETISITLRINTIKKAKRRRKRKITTTTLTTIAFITTRRKRRSTSTMATSITSSTTAIPARTTTTDLSSTTPTFNKTTATAPTTSKTTAPTTAKISTPITSETTKTETTVTTTPSTTLTTTLTDESTTTELTSTTGFLDEMPCRMMDGYGICQCYPGYTNIDNTTCKWFPKFRKQQDYQSINFFAYTLLGLLAFLVAAQILWNCLPYEDSSLTSSYEI